MDSFFVHHQHCNTFRLGDFIGFLAKPYLLYKEWQFSVTVVLKAFFRPL